MQDGAPLLFGRSLLTTHLFFAAPIAPRPAATSSGAGAKISREIESPSLSQQVRRGNQQKDSCRERLRAPKEGKALGSPSVCEEDQALAGTRAGFN